MEHRENDSEGGKRENRSTGRKSCLSVTLSTRNPTRVALALVAGSKGRRKRTGWLKWICDPMTDKGLGEGKGVDGKG